MKGAATALVVLVAVLGMEFAVVASTAEARSPRRAYYEGMREIARERREMRRDILRSDSRREAREAYYEGMREIARERREMRRDLRRSIRRRQWYSHY